ncbi:CBS domain-containing protein [Streptomyces qinglanensis]|uniref:CBS domain-containing protein n=1 Tax=Streptomyces qinglanensis TaxID=943816 RepID=A0A1H9R353_9ACTN|nr:CBS domain-containing protein [Streptomyces qinglanensis]SER67142.1 CBS domain-containing protein [Streptomyces qinglanensis]
MTTAADIMHPGVRWVPATETLDRAAQLMREMDVGALPVSDPNDPNERMCGIITDRDIVIRCIAAGRDPSRVTAGELCEGTPRWISAEADLSEVLREMETHQIRRLPVIDGNKRVVGVISETDLGRHHLNDKQLAGFVEQVYA